MKCCIPKNRHSSDMAGSHRHSGELAEIRYARFGGMPTKIMLATVANHRLGLDSSSLARELSKISPAPGIHAVYERYPS
jgi:hypothetical protein